MEHLNAIGVGAANLTVHVLGQESLDLLNEAYGTSPKAVLSAMFFTVGTVVVTLAVLLRVGSAMIQRQRRRVNDMLVTIAEQAPVNDDDEHEFAKHDDARAAAPGDSDFEDDALSPKKKGIV